MQHGALTEPLQRLLYGKACSVRAVLNADIMPVYHLGDSQLFHFWGLNALSRKLRASLGFVWGRWGLPLPMQHDLISAISYPIKGEQRIHPVHI